MGRFAARRLGRMAVTLTLATFVFFSAVTVLPGDPIRALFGFRPPPPELYEQIRQQFHLDEPLPTQYVLYMGDLVRGDLGHSFPDNPFGRSRLGRPVSATLRATLPVSLRILGLTILIQAVAGLGLGVLATLRRGRVAGVAVYATAVVLVATPVLVAGIVLQSVMAYELSWLPYQWVNRGGWTNYVLPIAALSAGSAAYTILLTRAELTATLRRPFVAAAVARGIAAPRVVGIHALRASLVPVVAFVTANLGSLIAGLVVVEGVFNVPGAGGALFRALRQQDRALIMVVIMLTLMAVIVVNALADLVYSIIDPRIRRTD
jgi:ABC-type dipeptide/oligopeptide/nickel transport system permease component